VLEAAAGSDTEGSASLPGSAEDDDDEENLDALD
jgi:hypothetical protein